MQCPDCHSEDTRRNGRTKSGRQTYKCKACGRRFTGNPEGRPPVMGDRPLTEAEKKRRYRQKLRLKKLASENS